MPRRGGVLQRVLTTEEKQQVARWLGEFLPPARIPQLVRETFGKRISHQYAYTFQSLHRWQTLIDRYRQEWLVKLDIPLSYKKVRLAKLQRCLQRLELKEDAVDGASYERRLLALLTAARLEMEEKPDSNTNFFFANINQYTDEELLQRRAELVKRIQAFRWPNTRRLTNGMGRSEGGTETASTDSEDDGGNGQIGHVEIDLSSP